MSKTIYIGGRLESKEKGNVVAGANAIKDDTKGKMQNVINKETDDELLRLEQSKQDNLTFDNAPTEDSTNPVTSGGVYTAEKALSDAIEAILLLIPSAATALNKLVDTNTMNSSMSTATATFRGTYNAVTDLGLTYQATHAQIEAALDALGLTADNNDYAFVQVPVSDQSQDIAKTERYKNNGTNWQYEYDLNTSGFTAAQWGAINSTITLTLVQKLAALPTNAELLQALGLKQDVLTFDNAPTTDSNNPVKSGGIKNAIDTAAGDEATARENADLALAGLIGDEKTRAEGIEGGLNTRLGAVEGSVNTIQGVIPSGATSSNKLVDNNSMTTYIGTIIDNIDATFNVTSTDGHVTLAITQVNGVITSVQLTTSDIASAAALNLKASQADLTALAGRVTTAEGNITSLTGRMTTAESDIDTLTNLYNALQQSAPQVIQPTDTWPVANPSATTIYRVIDRVNTPPEYYSDYMWNGTAFVLMAQYNNAIDDEPTAGSNNLVKSGGVAVKIDELRLETTGLVVSTALNTSVKNYYTQEIPVYAGVKYTGKLIANQSIGQSVLNFVFLLDNSNVKQENLNARDMSVAYGWEFTPVANGMLKFQYYLEGIQTEAVLSVIIEGELRKDIDKNTERIISAEDAISKTNSDNAIFLGVDYTTSKSNYKFTYPIQVKQGDKVSGVVKSNIPVGQSVFNIDFRDEDNTQIAYKLLNAQDLSTEISWESTVAVKDAIVYLNLYISGGVDSHIDMAILGNLGKTVRENKQSIDGIQLKDDILIDLSDKARFSVAGFDLTENTDGTLTLTNIGGFDGWQTIDFWGKEKYVSGKPYRLLLDLEVIKSSSRFAYFIAKSGNASSDMGFDLKTRKFYDIRILNTNGIDASEIFVQLSTKSTTSWNAGDIELKIYGFAVIDDMETPTEDLMSWCRFYGFDTVDKKKIANLSYMSYLAEHVKDNDSARVIDCWGDSLTEYGHPSYPQTLAALSGRMVNNYGDGGRTSQYIRELFLHGFEETHEKYGGSTAKQYDFPEHFNAEHTNIIWVGRNNVNLDEDWQSVIDDVKAMVDALGNSNYLVLMPPNGHYGTFGTDGTDGTGELKGGGVYEKFFMTLEERLSSIFGNHFFNVREAIIYGWSQNIKLLSSFTQPQIGSTVTIEVSDATSLTTYNADDVRVWGSEFMSKFVIGLNEEYDVYSVVSKLDDTHISATLVESNRVLPGNIVENVPCTDQNGDGVHFPKDLKVEQYADYMCRLYDTLPSSFRIDGIHHSDNGRLFVAKLIFDAINAIKI